MQLTPGNWAAPGIVLGIDPGKIGAAVLIGPPREVLAVAAWDERETMGRGRYRVLLWRPGRGRGPAREEVIRIPSRPGAIGVHVGQLVRDTVDVEAVENLTIACETSYLGVNPKTLILLTRWSGALVGVIEESFGRPARWIEADGWRKTCLGLPIGTKREVVKEASRRLMPARLPGLADPLRLISGDSSHVTDAAGVAEHVARAFSVGMKKTS